MKIGLKYFKYSKVTITVDGTTGAETETYGTVKTAAKAMTLSVNVNRSNVKGYADDAAAESDLSFIDGSMTLEGDDLSNETIADLCGATLDSGTGGTGDLTFKEDDNPGYVRFGTVVPMVKAGTRAWIGLIFTRVKFAAPEDNYQTKGQNVEFRGWSMSGDIMKNSAGVWKIQSARKTSEADALTWLASNLAPT